MLFLILALVGDSTSLSIPVAPAESIHVEVIGHGDPVVLLPGLFGSAYGFRKVMPRLAEAGYQAIAIEPLGIGASGRPKKADYSLSAQAERIGAVLDSMGISSAVVVAHSVGASIAFRLAVIRPELVAGVVSLDGGPAEAAATPGFRKAIRWAPWLRLFGGVGRIRGKIRTYLKESSRDSSWVTEDVVLGYTEHAAQDIGATLRAYYEMAYADEPYELRPRLGQVQCPVRLAIGTHPHEGGVQPDEIRLLQERLMHFAIDSIPDAGHFVFEEQPDAVVRIVDRLTVRNPPYVAAGVRQGER